MKINIKATNIELTPSISSYVEKRISSLEKYLGQNTDAVVQVEIGKESQHHKSGDIFRAEVRIGGAGLDLYAVSNHSDLYAAIDVVKDEIVRELSNKKGRIRTLTRRGGQMVKDMMKGLNFFKKRS